MRKLTEREIAILEAYQNEPTKEVARKFNVMPQSITDTLQRVYYKLGVSRKEDAIKVAREQGYQIRN